MLVYADGELLAKNIRFLRNRRKMSRAEFANFIPISGAQLHCIERLLIGHIYLDALNNISQIYGIPSEEILTEDLEQKYRGKRFHYNR